jgi:uncharacterized protein (DUF1499 family)
MEVIFEVFKALCAFSIFIFLGSKVMAAPLINDITTTPEAPPEYILCAQQPANKNRDMAYPKHFEAIQKKHYPNLKPLILEESKEELFSRILKTAQKMPRWEVLGPSGDQIAPGPFRLEAVSKTKIFRFRDDIVIEVRDEPKDQTSSIHMRSKSRLGKGDFGANAKRIEQFFSMLSKN